MTTQSDERGGDEMTKITESEREILMVRLGEVIHAWKMLDASISDYMAGLADGAEVAKIQRYTRDLIENNR